MAPLQENGGPPPPESHSSFTLDDVWFALFRHKWMILFFAAAGLAVAAGLYVLTPRLYHSEARVLVKYLPQKEALGPGQGEGQNHPLVLRGEGVVGSEIDLLTSLDLAKKVAEIVGPERVLAALGGGTNLDGAAATIQGGVVAYAMPKASVIRVMFQHRDRSVVQPVLSNLVAQYLLQSYEVHRALRNQEQFEIKRLDLEAQLKQTQAKLNAFMKSNSVFALKESQQAAAEEVEAARKALREAETDLDKANRILRVTNKDKEVTSEELPLDDEQHQQLRRKYAELSAQLDQHRVRIQASIAQGFTEQSGLVRPLRQSMTQLEEERKKLEKDNPELIALASASGTNQPLDPFLEQRKAEFLRITIDVLQARLQRAQIEQAQLYDIGEKINELERQKELQDTDYRYFTTQLAQAKFDSDLGAARDSNISVLQNPGPPIMSIGTLYKQMGAAAAGGIALGIALALLIEFFIDQRVKRPEEMRRLISVPLYLSIPKGASKARRTRLPEGHGGPAAGDASRALLPAHSTNGSGDHLQPYFEALRDRVLSRFEAVARKPKLVGVCGSVGGSAGGTRIAAGLAGALSEAGDLKILLVDMKMGTGKSHPILGTRKSLTLQDALDHQNQEEGLVAPNLYLAAAEGSDPHAVTTSPPRFTRVIPQLNASDYDYIVFDMPEVDQISITPRLAKHMDLMLLVVEAEKAHRNAVKQAGSLLLEFTPNVAVVLNNVKASLPKSLRQAV